VIGELVWCTGGTTLTEEGQVLGE